MDRVSPSAKRARQAATSLRRRSSSARSSSASTDPFLCVTVIAKPPVRLRLIELPLQQLIRHRERRGLSRRERRQPCRKPFRGAGIVPHAGLEPLIDHVDDALPEARPAPFGQRAALYKILVMLVECREQLRKPVATDADRRYHGRSPGGRRTVVQRGIDVTP